MLIIADVVLRRTMWDSENLCDSNWFINSHSDWHRAMLHVYGFEFRLINDAALNLPRVIGNFSRRLSRLAEKFEIESTESHFLKSTFY